jgi:hypothetical protein
MRQKIHGQRHYFHRRRFVFVREFDLDPSELLPRWAKEAKYRSLDLIKAPRDRDAVT